MGTSGQVLVGTEEVPRRRIRTVAERRRIVEETLARRESVAVIARKYAVNANLVFHWRRMYKQGLLEVSREPAAKLLPVEVTTPTVVATRSAATQMSKSRARPASAGPTAASNHLEIEWPSGIRVRVHGLVEPDVLSTVLATLAAQQTR